MKKKEMIYASLGVVAGIILAIIIMTVVMKSTVKPLDSTTQPSGEIDTETEVIQQEAQQEQIEADIDQFFIKDEETGGYYVEEKLDTSLDYAEKYYVDAMGYEQVLISQYENFFRTPTEDMRKTAQKEFNDIYTETIQNLDKWENYVAKNKNELNSMNYNIQNATATVSELRIEIKNMKNQIDQNLIPPKELQEEHERKMKLKELSQPPDANNANQQPQ